MKELKKPDIAKQGKIKLKKEKIEIKINRLIDFIKKYPKLWSLHIINFRDPKVIEKIVNDYLYEQSKIDEPKVELMEKLKQAENDYEYIANRAYRGALSNDCMKKIKNAKVGRRFGYRREIEVLASGYENEDKFAEFLYIYDKNNGGLARLKKCFIQEVRDNGEIKDTPYIENLESIHFDISSASLHNEDYDRLYDSILEIVNFKRNYYNPYFRRNDEKKENPERQFRIIDSNAMKQIIEKKLKPNERTVLRFRYGLDGNERLTLENVGNKIGVKRERVRQIETEAIRKMERYFGEYLIELSPEYRAKFVETYFSKHSIFKDKEEKSFDDITRLELINLVAHSKDSKGETIEEPEELNDKPVKEPELDPIKEKEKPIESLELSNRAYYCLKRANINTIGDITAVSTEDITKIRNLGKGTYNEIMEKIHAKGLKFADEEYMSSILQSGVEATKSSSRTESINEQMDKITQIIKEIEGKKTEKGED